MAFKHLAIAIILAFFGVSAHAQLQCVDTNNTVMITQKWGDQQRRYSRNYGHIGDNDALIIKVQVPTTVIPSSKTLYSISGAEWLDGNTLRYFKVSNRPCDFGILGSSSFGAYFAVNNTPVIKKYSWWYKEPIPTFKPGETIYFNLKNSPGCYPTCNVFWSFFWR